ncbi:autotransporter domain-containing protein [Sphingoaurantiacus capsulatus]|uniref:Autotransporter domain-containing protein n=1 Tax=Sphingoaurantiacus capsulatus TaxID=1771310 RepID=A0ABV7X8P4_9SPHN
MRYMLLAVTALPLIQVAAAHAETRISTATTAPVATSTIASGARDDLTIEKAGSIKPAAAGVAVTVDSANNVKNDGEINLDDKDNSVGVRFTTTAAAGSENNGTVRLMEDFTGTDDDKDGDLDGPFAKGTGRHAIRLDTGVTVTGNITNSSAGVISVEGNDSSGIRLDGRLVGNLNHAGVVSVTGDRSVGVLATAVEGIVALTGSVTAIGEGSTAVSLGDVSGVVHLQNAISATGYRSTDRGTDAVRAKLDADDLRQGGAAVRIAGSVGGGILLDKPPVDGNADDKDEDKDGVPDADERSAVLTSYGAAPALDLGGAGAPTVIGRVGTGDNAYGVVNKGQIRGLGINDGVAATALRIGQAGGGTTRVEGGINNIGGTINAASFGAAATGILLNAGARADELRNSGEIGAVATTEGAAGAAAVRIEAGATMTAIRNSGTIGATVNGEAADSVAILDRSGTLATIENTGRILAKITPTDDANDKDDADLDAGNEAITGRAVAVDLRANTSGALIRQTRASATADLPSLTGQVLMGSGADRVELLSGSYLGMLSFGAGADTLLIDGGATVTAELVDSDGALAVSLGKGSLTVVNTAPLALSSLSIGAEGQLRVAIDPAAATALRFDVAGAATIASGAKIEIELGSLLRGTREFEIIRAGSLTLGDATTTLTGAPYLYAATLRRDAATNSLYAGVRAKTAAELGLNRSGAEAYAAVFDRLDRDARIESAFLGAEDEAAFDALYNQMLPDHSGGSLLSAAAISSAMSAAMAAPVGRVEGGSGLAVWGQEILFNLRRDADDAAGFKANGLGLAAGLERAGNGHALGLAASFVATTYKDRGAAADEEVVMQFAQAGAYWRGEIGRLRANVRAALGHVWFDSDRKLVGAGVDLAATADWTGWLGDAHAGAAYELGSGWLVARPELSVDYVYLKEKGYRESGGGEGFDLAVDGRDGQLLTGTAALTLGARFGDTFRWGPEVKAGWRQRLAGTPGRTTARFLSGGSDFTLSPEEVPDGEKMVQLALRGQTEDIAFGIEVGTAFDGGYRQHDVRATVRFAF